MKNLSKRVVRVICAWLIVGMVPSPYAYAQTPPAEQPAQQTAAPIKPEEIEALVAPIALYPDSLLSQVLMASTYPLEVVYAARWVKANPKIKGDAAVKAVENEAWDVSVKSLVAFPQILEPMNDKLDWTQKLGDAFLAQEKDVLAAVQRLRGRAKDSGNLNSNEQQKVIVEPPVAGTTETIVRIEPANPQTIYVPAYNPTVVYGSWGYPGYPPYYWPPYPAYYPGAALATGLAWGIGIAAAGAIFGGCNWGGGNVNINVNRATNIDRSFNSTKVQNGKWQHDGSHRQGVAYRDNATREKFGKDNPGASSRENFRGRDAGVSDRDTNRGGAGDRGGVGDRGGAGDRGGVGDSNRGGVGDNSRGGAGDRASPGVSDRAGGGVDRGGGAGGRSNVSSGAGASNRAGGGRDSGAFQGVGSGGAAQHDFDRGRASTNASGGNRSGGSFGGSGAGAGSRGGGGGRAGGGGGRGGGGRR